MSTQAVSELRLRMIEDMKARQLNQHTQRSHIYSCKRFAAYLERSPDTATADEVRAFQLYLMETGPSIGNRSLPANKPFAAFLKPVRRSDWVVYAKKPFAGPEAVLAYLSRYTHRVAISNRRLIAADENGVTFTYKDYRLDGPQRYKTMTLDTHEFIRRFLMHVMPRGFHRIFHGHNENNSLVSLFGKPHIFPHSN